MNIPPKYEDVVAQLEDERARVTDYIAQRAQTELKLEAALGREAALREELSKQVERANDYASKLTGAQQRLTVAEKNERHWRGVASEATCRAASLNDQVQELDLENSDLKSGILTILHNSDRTSEMLIGTNEASKAKDKSGIAPKGPFPPGPHIDQQGYKIKIGVAYRFVFGMPGPDVTSVIIESFNDDGSVNVFDPSFKIKAENLGSGRFWRPLMRGWDDISDRKAIVEYAGESALDLTP